MTIVYDGVKDWLYKYKSTSVKKATFDRLITAFNKMKQYQVCCKWVEQLEIKDLQDYVNRMYSEGLSLSTIRKQFQLISAYLRHAELEGLIQRPIYKGVRLPGSAAFSAKNDSEKAYDPDQQDDLLRVLLTHAHIEYDIAVLMLETGLRIGEALALSWKDVNWNRRCLSVNKTYVHLSNGNQFFIQDSPKSATSRRTVPLSRRAIDVLRWRKSNTPDPEGYVFARPSTGELIGYNSVRKQIRKACEEAGVPYCGLHIFRHTFATNCYHKNCDVKTLSKMLGHASTSLTFNTYIHLYGDNLEEMRAFVD